MSIKSIGSLKDHIEPRRTIVVNQSMATATNFTVSMQPYVHFVPTHVIIRQLLYSNVAGTDNGTYLIWSSLAQDYIAAVYVGIQGVALNPQTMIPIAAFQNQINFNVTPANAAFTGPTGQLTMVLEFC